MQERYQIIVSTQPDYAAGVVEAERVRESGRRLLRVAGIRHHRAASGVPSTRVLQGHETRHYQQEVHQIRGMICTLRDAGSAAHRVRPVTLRKFPLCLH